MTPAGQRHRWALLACASAQVRVTPVRERVLAILSRHAVPVTLAGIASDDELANQFDDATVYRTLVLFMELGVVRQLQFQGRQTHFILNVPGECFTFLICRCCGLIIRLPHGDLVQKLERETAVVHGYTKLTHELELFGTCPDCQKHEQACQKPSKLSPGLRLRGRFRQ